MKLIINLVIIFFILHCPSVWASYKEACQIKYVSTGKVYEGVCNYLTGSELNQATGSYSYGFSNYAVFFWQQGQASVIKLNGFFMCGFEAGEGCMSQILPINGTDQQGRDWKVCQPNHYFC